MDLALQPKPEVEITQSEKGIISKQQYFVQKKFEQINQYCFPVHFIRNWRPKAQLLYPSVPDERSIQYECDFNRDVQNCFVEDYAEEVFLRTPPPCFVVIGKSGANVKKLSREIAEEYGSVLIQVDDIIGQVIQADIETSGLLRRILRLGVALTLNFVLPLLSLVAHTPEAKHRGYVLCGLPRIPDGCDLPVEQQFNYLFSWDNKPTVFINVLFDDEDLFKERINLRHEAKDSDKGKFILPHLQYELSDDEDEVENPHEKDLLPVKEEKTPSRIDIDISPSRPWVRLPKDEDSQVWSELEQYSVQIQPVIDLILSRVDPQYFITVDARVENEFEMVRARLNLLQIWKSPVAFPFLTPELRRRRSENYETPDEDENKEEIIESEEDAEILRVADEPPQVAFLTLFSKKTISPKYRWELSHYNYICPVSLRESVIVEGKSEFAVAFMKYIYFLRDEECMRKFLQNPRAFVLPIRPKPLCRFIILGYPYSGKTILARALSQEFSIPLLDLKNILAADINRKKSIYVEFCRRKAECKEILRLTAMAWHDWRAEEEHRVTLIENWIVYIQSLLSQRLTQFYFPEQETKMSSPHESIAHIVMPSEDYEDAGEGKIMEKPLGVRGISLETSSDVYAREYTPVDNHSTPSVKIIHAMKHEDFDFHENGLEVEANLFFSSLWNTFSNRKQRHSDESSVEGEAGEGGETPFENDSVTIDWSKLLPAQSLSTLLLSRKPYTIREKRKSFQVLLEAASKNYWTENTLKSEFAKWRLPCFMDIPMCEIFIDNPILLLKYVPEWLRERPTLPDPIENNHYRVMEAGNAAAARAGVVKISHNYEEVAILLRDAVEKVEREGMRVSGEIISPGGWVLDNMTLDIDVWKRLACENIFPDHIYILYEPDPEFRRILNKWCELYCPEEEKSAANTEQGDVDTDASTVMSKVATTISSESVESEKFNLRQTLMETLEQMEQVEEEVDEIYSAIQNEEVVIKQSYKDHTDVFSQSIFSQNVTSTKVGAGTYETQSASALTSESATGIPNQKEADQNFSTLRLGVNLEIFTDKILQAFMEIIQRDEVKPPPNVLMNELEFFVNLLTLPQKLSQIKKFLASINREKIINEIDITDQSSPTLFMNIKAQLMEPFIKKPRELEEFEMDEIQKWTEKDIPRREGEDEEDEDEENRSKEEPEEEDVRIFGESGALCIVNLENNICLPGKPDIALRYYGKLYYFWDKEAKRYFMNDPERYAPYYSAIRCYPPLRCFVMGPIGSGKTELCHLIADQCSVNYVDYLSFLNKNLNPNLKRQCTKFTALEERSLIVGDEHNAAAKQARERFLRSPVSYRTSWMECPFYSNFDSYKEIIHPKTTGAADVPEFPELTYQSIEPGLTSLEDYDLPPPLPFVRMSDVEETLNKYIRCESPLSGYCVDNTLRKLWTDSPYITKGFVIESFPMRAFDVKVMLERNWIPDVIIELNVPEDVLLENNVDRMMELWEQKLKYEMAEESVLRDVLEIIQRSTKWVRRDELLSEKMDALTRETYGEGGEGGEAEECYKEIFNKNFLKKKPSTYGRLSQSVEENVVDEVQMVLDQEFPPFVFNTIYESYEAGKERLVQDLLANYRRDVQEIATIKKLLQDTDVKWYEVKKDKEGEININQIFVMLNQLMKRHGSKGEFAFTMKLEMAEKLLDQGYYFLSKFGRWCPVQAYQAKNSIHMFRPLSSRGKIVPIAYRNYIYFVGGENEKEKFLSDPIKYTFNDPHLSNVPVRAAVIGPPKSGKSTLCMRLGAMFGLKVVTMGTALRFVVENIPRSTLARNVNDYLRRGCFLPLSLKIEALFACLNDPACVTQGFVLDGIPFDAALTQSLAEKGKLPFVIISLTADVDFGKTNRQNLVLSPYRLPYKNRTNLDMRYKDWGESYKKFSQWNQSTYNNLYEVKARASTVDVFYQAYDIIRNALFDILHYVQYCVSDKALPLRYLCVTHQEFEARKGSLEDNCPVCWGELKILSSNSGNPDRRDLFQYLEHFYWVCPDHREKFTKTPKIFFPPWTEECPQVLPKVISRKKFETMSPQPNIHGYGRCPVMSTDFPSRLDWEGSWDFAALYAGEVFLCKNKELLDRFLARPWNYANADTIFEVDRGCKSKAIEDLAPPTFNSLPTVGFLEQSIADFLNDSLRIVGSVRPVYPNLSLEVTGCVFLGLLLKSVDYELPYRQIVKSYSESMAHNYYAANFTTRPFRKQEEEIGQGDFGIEAATVSSESLLRDTDDWVGSFSQGSVDSNTLIDFEYQADKQIWSAKIDLTTESWMYYTAMDTLEEIPVHPKTNVVFKYQSYELRINPLPMIPNCVTYIYSAQPNMEIPEPFNCNTLYQPLPLLTPPYSNSMVFNVEKEVPLTLYSETASEPQSREVLNKGPRAYSAKSLVEFKPFNDPDYLQTLILGRFMPRFQFLDKMPPLFVPPIPKVVEEEMIVYNPQRDQTYMMLYAEFFHMSHSLRCYEWSEIEQFLELDKRLDKNLASAAVEVEFLRRPEIKRSIEMPTKMDDYHLASDVFAKFVTLTDEREIAKDPYDYDSMSLTDFIRNIIQESINDMFVLLAMHELSYDSFEAVVFDNDVKYGKPEIYIREIIPFPPLPWDIICRPYFAYSTARSIFEIPSLENIAHERQFSLLDGIQKQKEKLRFVRYPSCLKLEDEEEFPMKEKKKLPRVRKKPFYFVFDFFHLPWTSFMTYPFAWAYNEDVTTYLKDSRQKY